MSHRFRALPFAALLMLVVLTLAGGVPSVGRADVTEAPSLIPHYSMRAHIRNIGAPHGAADLAFAPGVDRLFIAFSHDVYQGQGDTLAVIDTKNGYLREIWSGPDLSSLAVSRDSMRLYAYSPVADTIKVFDTRTLDLLDEFPTPCPAGVSDCEITGMLIGPNQRLYTYGYPYGYFTVSDALTGATITSWQAYADKTIVSATIQGNRLFFVASNPGGSGFELARYDVGGATPTPELAAPVAGYLSALQATPDGRFIAGVSSAGLTQLDAETLTVIRTIPSPGVLHNFSSQATARDGETMTGLQGWDDAYHLHTYRLDDGAYIRVGDIDTTEIGGYSSLNSMIALKDGELAVVFPNTVYIFHPSDYAVALSTVFRNHCGTGPIRDDFSDPSSGWPQADFGPVAFRYDSGQYSILQREADRWSAASRGDFWINARYAKVRTWVPAKDGISGIVFGLNDNWTSFFTFEIIPSLQRWVVFRYGEDGWELWGTQVDTRINPTGVSNVLKLEDNASWNETFLYVNDSLVFRVPRVAGRIALSGGSFEPEVDLRFDDYVFVGENCPLPMQRASEVDVAPSIDRPPVETFLRP